MSRKPITPWYTVDGDEFVRCHLCGWAGTLQACYHRYMRVPEWDGKGMTGKDRWEFQCRVCTELVAACPAPPFEYLSKYGPGTTAHWYDASVYSPGSVGRYLVYTYYNDSIAIGFWNGGEWQETGAFVTFWAPLPDKPESPALAYVSSGHGRAVREGYE